MTSDGPEVFERLLSLLATHPVTGRQVHDANLGAAMVEQGISRLLTFNAGDFQRFADTIEIVALVRS